MVVALESICGKLITGSVLALILPSLAAAGPPLLEAAAEDLRNGRRERAVEKVREYFQPVERIELEASGGRASSRWWRIQGAAACYARDGAAAIEALRHLDPVDQRFLRYVCNRNQVQLPDQHPDPEVELNSRMEDYLTGVARRVPPPTRTTKLPPPHGKKAPRSSQH